MLTFTNARCARKFGKWTRRRGWQPFHSADCKKIIILTENNDNCRARAMSNGSEFQVRFGTWKVFQDTHVA